MRKDVKKYLFYGHHRALESFFSEAQEVGLIHFIDTSHAKIKELPNDIQELTQAIKVLRELPVINQEEPEFRSEANGLTKEILKFKHRIEKLEEERRMTALEIARVEVFGDFSLKDIEYIEKSGKRRVQFFFAKKGIFDGKNRKTKGGVKQIDGQGVNTVQMIAQEVQQKRHEESHEETNQILAPEVQQKQHKESYEEPNQKEAQDNHQESPNQIPPNLIHVASEHNLDYFISINKELTQYDRLVEMRIDRELGELKSRLNEINTEIHALDYELKKYQKYKEFLHHVLIEKYDNYHLETAQKYAEHEMDGSLFAVEGWVPAHRINELKQKIAAIDVDIVEVAIEEGEVIPTYLENTGPNRLGEDLVHIYDVPSNTDKDPSLWVLVSFALFFSMIIGDGGYGLMFLAAAFYIRYKNPDMKKSGIRVWKLVMILCTSCVFWGLLTNSFFGISFGPDSSFRKVSALNWLVERKAAYHFEKKDDVYEEIKDKFPETAQATDHRDFIRSAKKGEGQEVQYVVINRFADNILIELSLFVGIIHICLSFLRYITRNWGGIGWVLFIIGAYFYIPEFLKVNTMMQYVFGFDRAYLAYEGVYLMGIGVGIACVISLIKNKWFGLLEITNSIQIFSDILSYLRLYALALAGSIISATINDIAGSLFFIAGGLLIVLGHAINMVLAIIGGVIHGLRLNFIEWYHYSFEGGGKAFNPLRKVDIE